nr:queuine tRNA-ribosyltransferase accessory subunit 2-like [Lytechinus pictus]
MSQNCLRETESTDMSPIFLSRKKVLGRSYAIQSKRNIRLPMKFILESITKEGCRCGIIKELGSRGNLAIDTPTCLLYTRAGAVPHLTWDLVEKMKRRPQCLQMTCATLADQQDSLSRFGKGIGEFASIPANGMIYSSIQDPAHPTPTGYNDKNSVSIFTPSGRTKVTWLSLN